VAATDGTNAPAGDRRMRRPGPACSAQWSSSSPG